MTIVTVRQYSGLRSTRGNLIPRLSFSENESLSQEQGPENEAIPEETSSAACHN